MGEGKIRPQSLRWHLFQVLLFGVLPVGLLAATLLYLHWRAQVAEHARVQMETTRLLAAAVDSQLDSTIKRLAILGRLFASPDLRGRQLYEHARSAASASPDWTLLLAASGEGEGIFRTDVPYGRTIPSIRDRAYFRRALDERRAVVSDLFVSPVSGEKVLAVALPWMEQGRVGYVLATSLNLRWFDELLNRHGLPPGGIAGIFDGSLKFVARSHDGDARRAYERTGPYAHEIYAGTPSNFWLSPGYDAQGTAGKPWFRFDPFWFTNWGGEPNFDDFFDMFASLLLRSERGGWKPPLRGTLVFELELQLLGLHAERGGVFDARGAATLCATRSELEARLVSAFEQACEVWQHAEGAAREQDRLVVGGGLPHPPAVGGEPAGAAPPGAHAAP